MGAEQRPVLPPRLSRFLVELAADKKEQLGRFVNHVINHIRQKERSNRDCYGARDAYRLRRFRKPPSRPLSAPSPPTKNEHFANFCHEMASRTIFPGLFT